MVQNLKENHLRNPSIQKNDLNELISKLKRKNKEAKFSLDRMKCNLRNNQLIEFEPNTEKLLPNIFGSFAIRPDVKLYKNQVLSDNHIYYINSAIFYPNDKLIISCFINIKIWDLKTNECLQTMQDDQEGSIEEVRLSSDKTKLIAAIQDKDMFEVLRIKIFCLRTFTILNTKHSCRLFTEEKMLDLTKNRIF